MADDDPAEDDRYDITRFVKGRKDKIGHAPGSLVYIGEERDTPISIQVTDYTAESYNTFTAEDVEDSLAFQEKDTVTWINVDGLHDPAVIAELADSYDIHPLLREDLLNTDQRPKFEDMDDYLFLQMKMLQYDKEIGQIQSEQVSFIMSKNVLLTFQETSGDVFDGVRDRLKAGKGQIRKNGTDYLMYALVDAIVDNYFLVLEHLGEHIEFLEDELVSDPTTETLQTVHELKRELIFLRKSVWPLREIISKIERSESDLIQERTRLYLRDVYEHTIQVIDIIETFRDMVSGALDIYLSSISNRMNSVMKVLTIIATIFIPLTFVTGIYGMNFNTAISPWNMPELNWFWGYPAVLAVMVLIIAGQLYYFKQKDWL